MRRWIRRALRGAAWGIVIGCTVVCLGGAVAGPAVEAISGEQLLIVTSGSMEPKFAAGDIVMLRPVTDPTILRPNQIVTFWPVEGGHLVTHRITELKMLPVLEEGTNGQMVPQVDSRGRVIERPYIVTKGDANATPDPNATPLTQVRGIVMRSYSHWGYVLQWLQSPVGRAALLVPAALLVAAMEGLDAYRSFRKRQRVKQMLANQPPKAVDRWDVHALPTD